MPRWVFLDVGNVLLDEDPLTYLVFRRHVEAVQRVRPDLTFLDLLAERQAKARAGSRWPVFETVSTYLDEARCAAVWEEAAREVRTRFAELSPLLPGADEVVRRLSRRYPLGLIANQGPECRARLSALGLLDHFSVVVLSEEAGRSKPDPELFRLALDHAVAQPEDCLMVGDRLDNDIAPAAALGMATAWVRWPDVATKKWPAPEADALAYRAALESDSRHTSRRNSQVRPSFRVNEVRRLVGALSRFDSSQRLPGSNHARRHGKLGDFCDL